MKRIQIFNVPIGEECAKYSSMLADRLANGWVLINSVSTGMGAMYIIEKKKWWQFWRWFV